MHVRTETEEGVRSLVLCRPEEYNTITQGLADELAAAVEEADADPDVRVMLLRAEGPAFCAGYGLDWATGAQASEGDPWDAVADLRMLSRFNDAYLKLWDAWKPTVAAVQGWCLAGGTDLVLHADLVIAAEGASFGYPPARVWGIPTTPMWVHRMGVEQAKRYLLTGDEIPAPDAAELGLVLETVPDDRLLEHSMALARRMARLPVNQLVMLKRLCNHPVEQMGLRSGRTLGLLFDGIARHTPEGRRFVERAAEAGFRQAVRERDEPFGDYGERENPAQPER